jgi:hypothetical protein
VLGGVGVSACGYEVFQRRACHRQEGGSTGWPRITVRRELRARGADMDWDQAVAYTLTQATQALNELESASQP